MALGSNGLGGLLLILVPPLLVLGAGFGWVYDKTGRLTAPIVMHALFNAGNLVLALLFVET